VISVYEKNTSTVQFVWWDMSYGLEMCSSFPARTVGWGQVDLNVASAVIESTSCVKFHFNNISLFIIMSVIFTVVFVSMNRMQGEV
jgi:hypothetical protein